MLIGYVRVSTTEQNTERQEDVMARLGVERVYLEHASGKDANRPQLRELLEFIREGDTLVVESFSRFARSTSDLLELTERLTAKGVRFVSLQEAVDTTTPTGKFMLTVFGAVAELEREAMLRRQREGIEIAKRSGKYKGRKPIDVDKRRFARVYADWKAGLITAVVAQNRLGLTPSTFYRRVAAWERSGEVNNRNQAE
jgi:DNA invertase Pin-like site-specific DNA recombinase